MECLIYVTSFPFPFNCLVAPYSTSQDRSFLVSLKLIKKQTSSHRVRPCLTVTLSDLSHPVECDRSILQLVGFLYKVQDGLPAGHPP